MLHILLADDELSNRTDVLGALRGAGHGVTRAADAPEAAALLRSHVFDVIVANARLRKGRADLLMSWLRAEAPSADVLVVGPSEGVAQAIEAIRRGAKDYLTAPVELDALLLRIRRIEALREVEHALDERQEHVESESPMVFGQSPSMVRLAGLIDSFAKNDAPVLVQGESGTGKELVARRIHDLSARANRPFVAVNCAAFPDTLLEAELFGHERGAFTGAVRKRVGRFQAAEGGTLFLDEISELSLPAQAKLLRVLQERTFEPLGTNTSVHFDVRIVSATHRDLKERISAGAFREDLYYRIHVLQLMLPPLRQRSSDLPALAAHFLTRFTPEGKAPLKIAPEAWSNLEEYPFPGNVRELEHALRHASILCRGRGGSVIRPEDLPVELEPKEETPGALQDGDVAPLRTALRQFERKHLLFALRVTSGRKALAAKKLGLSRKSLWRKLVALGVTEEELASHGVIDSGDARLVGEVRPLETSEPLEPTREQRVVSHLEPHRVSLPRTARTTATTAAVPATA